MGLTNTLVTLLVIFATVGAELCCNHDHGELAAGVDEPAGRVSRKFLDHFPSDEYRFKVQCGRKHVNHSNALGARIFNGTAAREDQFPSFVALARLRIGGNYEHFCGGVLIDKDLVLTSAHCIVKPKVFAAAQTIWEANIWNEKNVTHLRPARVCIGNLYGLLPSIKHGPRGVINDYGLIRLAEPFKNVHTACLPTRKVVETDNVTLVGLGLNSSSLHYFVGQQEACPAKDLHRSTICLRAKNFDSSACEGDSGGPIYADQDSLNTVIALNSYGPASGQCLVANMYIVSVNLFNLRKDILKLAASCELTKVRNKSTASYSQKIDEKLETDQNGDESLVQGDQIIGNKSLFVSVFEMKKVDQEFSRKVVCRGVLVSKDLVLTAGRCLGNFIMGLTMDDKDINLTPESSIYRSDGTCIGFGYGYFTIPNQMPTTINDYGLIKLHRPVEAPLLARTEKLQHFSNNTLRVFLKSNCKSSEPPKPYAVRLVTCDEFLRKLGPSNACFELQKTSSEEPGNCITNVGSPIFSKISEEYTTIVGLVTEVTEKADRSGVIIFGPNLMNLREDVAQLKHMCGLRGSSGLG